MRKAINFFNSYWTIANELKDSDRLAFYDAILHYQFTGDNSKILSLTGLAKFAFISQQHSIESQINGYLDSCKKLKTKPFDYPCQGGMEGGTKGGMAAPSLQVQGEVQVQVQGKGKVQVAKSEKVFSPPSVDEVKDYFKECGYKEIIAIKAFNHYHLADWHDTNGKKVKNWKQKLSTNWFKDEHKINFNSQQPTNLPHDWDKMTLTQRAYWSQTNNKR
jgi:hypothetical protein